MTWGPPVMPSPPDTRAADVEALSRVWIAALISVLGSTLGVAVPLALSLSGHFSITIPSTGGTVSFDQATLVAVIGIAIVGLVLSILSFWYYREGFLAVRPVDSRFSSAPTWALLTIIGLVMVTFGLIIVLVGFLQLLSCAGTTPSSIPAGCVDLGALLGGAALLLIGAIILLIGYIGTLVAIWRLGTRYNETLFKVGAVLLIFPYLSIIGQILILVGASSARAKVQRAPAYGMTPSVPYPPSPPYR
jgi:hypothetical protein